MEWLHTLFFGNGIAHAVLTFALVITVGILLGKVICRRQPLIISSLSSVTEQECVRRG